MVTNDVLGQRGYATDGDRVWTVASLQRLLMRKYMNASK